MRESAPQGEAVVFHNLILSRAEPVSKDEVKAGIVR